MYVLYLGIQAIEKPRKDADSYQDGRTGKAKTLEGRRGASLKREEKDDRQAEERRESKESKQIRRGMPKRLKVTF